jgi:aldose 1-epimerase
MTGRSGATDATGTTAPSARESVVDGQAAVELAAGRYTARFLPEVGMIGASLTCDGVEHLDFDAGRALAGHTTGIPLLYPWANRLSRMTYEVDGLWVDLDGEPPLHHNDGLVIHGTMLGAEGWRVEAVLADGTRALLQARFVFGDHPRQLRSFPFPHELIVFVELSDLGLRVTTEVRNTGVRAVPVSFGWHPYLRIPGVPRRALTVSLPDREKLVLDGRCLPTGETRLEAAGDTRLFEGAREITFDDCYRLVHRYGAPPGDRPVMALASAERRIEVELDDRFGYGQVYAPPDTTTVALEPMTAPIDALVSGDHRMVPPGERDEATFVIRVLDLTEPPPADEEEHP